ncbi:acetyl-coenzyme A transporter 1-domain-containing protein [Ochromonadaceae sp. CCMP2298]|nr:acetyl-coenzyme A transporter 1-domain-containing protein [Ochromonadaceae sp. CCMP2298]
MSGRESSTTQRKKMRGIDDSSSRDDSPSDIDKSLPDSSSLGGLNNQDRISMAVLILLYTLQGIPLGLSGSIPLLLKEKGASYEALSLFSLVSIPFSLKLLWAPLVDTYYFKSFGRRKTWLVPVQIVTGLVMITCADYVGVWIGEGDATPAVLELTMFFVFLYFLMATQDIAVDGWALTMLSREAVGYASVCNSIGQVLGIFMANQGFIALSDAKWCHVFLGINGGPLIDLPTFMEFWGYVFILTTIFIWVFKREEPADESEHPDSLLDTCKQVVSIFRLPSVQSFVVILLTCKVAFAPTDAIFGFKLQEYGMPKADIATLSPLLLLTSLLLPAFAGSWVSARPLDMMLMGLPVKIAVSAALWAMVQFTEAAYAAPDGPHASFLVPLTVLLLVNEIAGTLIFISFMSFFSKISDPSIGGSYMTLLNTVTNIGAKWPNSLSLFLLPKMTYTACVSYAVGSREVLPFPCTVDSVCSEHGGTCELQLDGYTIQVALGLVIGVLWLLTYSHKVQQLQALPYGEWLISPRSKGR